eukprot:Filipodium_phascolosomae@DN2477_c0_g1_i1.p1
MQSIYLDDLLPFVKFERAIMKIDVEGYEGEALERARRVFAQVQVDYIFMEWAFYSKETRSPEVTERMIKTLTEMRFQPCHVPTVADEIPDKLNVSTWRKWPPDIIWMRDLPYEELKFLPPIADLKLAVKQIDLSSLSFPDGRCLLSKTSPEFYICTNGETFEFPKESNFIEKKVVSFVEKFLTEHTNCGFLDIGAGLGQWGLLATSRGHPSIFIESQAEHLPYLVQSIQLAYAENQSIVVANTFSGREDVHSVDLDDLLPLIDFDTALVRIGMKETWNVLRKSTYFFSKVDVRAISMRWTTTNDELNREESKQIILAMSNTHFQAYSVDNAFEKPRRLDFASWETWPSEVVWLKGE